MNSRIVPAPKHLGQRSSTLHLPAEMAQVAELRRGSRMQVHQHSARRDQLSQLTSEECELRRKVRDQLTASVIAPELKERLHLQRVRRAEEVRAANALIEVPMGHRHDARGLIEPGDSSTGELWWAETDVHWNDPQLVAAFEPDGLHIGGEVVVSEESYLHHGLFEVVATFGLGNDRMPEGSRFTSTPFVLLSGIVDGAVIPDNGWLDWGDEWSKCWLNTSQTVLTPVNFAGIPSFLVLGTSSQRTQIINIETTGKIEMQRHVLPGFLSMPTVAFPMYDFARSNGILVELVVSFTYQLEGDFSSVFFHADAGNTVLLQTFQWNLARA